MVGICWSLLDWQNQQNFHLSKKPKANFSRIYNKRIDKHISPDSQKIFPTTMTWQKMSVSTRISEIFKVLIPVSTTVNYILHPYLFLVSPMSIL